MGWNQDHGNSDAEHATSNGHLESAIPSQQPLRFQRCILLFIPTWSKHELNPRVEISGHGIKAGERLIEVPGFHGPLAACNTVRCKRQTGGAWRHKETESAEDCLSIFRRSSNRFRHSWTTPPMNAPMIKNAANASSKSSYAELVIVGVHATNQKTMIVQCVRRRNHLHRIHELPPPAVPFFGSGPRETGSNRGSGIKSSSGLHRQRQERT
jgi:hypothetical protein